MLTGNKIIEEYKKGIIHIDPFDDNNIGPNSYDITIGPWYIPYSDLNLMPHDVLYLDDEAHVQNLLQIPRRADTHLFIHPKERILCHSIEFIGAVNYYVPMVATRSTLARLGLDLCGSAGFGDIGYINRWTLELMNYTNHTLAIPVGARIGQIFFEETRGRIDQKYTGKYQIKDNWSPEDMLPKIITGNQHIWENNSWNN